jgi:hypothetical protein
MLARRINATLKRLAGVHEAPEPSPGSWGARLLRSDPWIQAATLAYIVEEARRGSISVGEAISTISWWCAAIAPESLAGSLLGEPLELAGWGGASLEGVLSSLVSYALKPDSRALRTVLARVGRALVTPCSVDPRLEAERSRLEGSMKRLGLLLGLTLPILFVASLLYNPVIALASVAVAAALWGLVRRMGARFRVLNLESAWLSCKLSLEELVRIVSGKDLPSVAELMGVPEIAGALSPEA